MESYCGPRVRNIVGALLMNLSTREHLIILAMFLVIQGFVCVEVLWPSQPNGVISSAVSLPNHTFTGQA